MGLKHVEAHSLMKGDSDPNLLTRLLNLHAIILTAAKQYQKAVLVREEELALSLLDYATSLLDDAGLCNAAHLYYYLKQLDRVVDLMRKALAIRMITFVPSHPSMQETRDDLLAVYQMALIDPEMKKKVASESHRVCSVDGCNTVKEKMNRCLKMCAKLTRSSFMSTLWCVQSFLTYCRTKRS